MVTTFVLFLREGLEASLVLGMLLAALRQIGQAEKMRAVWIGAAVAILGALIGGIAIYTTIHEYEDTLFATTFEAITLLVAVVLLTSVTFYMQKHTRTMKKELTARANVAGSTFAIGLLAFTTVGREALETAVFTLATAFQGDGVLVVLGAVLGIAAALGLCILIYRVGYRLDFRIFFRVMGILLIFFAAGLLGNSVHAMQNLGWIGFGGAHLWDLRTSLSDESAVGGLLKTLVGYSDQPTALQAVVYVLYLAIVGTTFIWKTRKPIAAHPQAAPLPAASATNQA